MHARTSLDLRERLEKRVVVNNARTPGAIPFASTSDPSDFSNIVSSALNLVN